MKSYTFTLLPDELRVLEKIRHDLELIPGGGQLSDDEDEALWRVIEKIKTLAAHEETGETG